MKITTVRKPGDEPIRKIKVVVLVDRYVVPGSKAGQKVEVDDTPENRAELAILQKFGQARLDDGEEVAVGQLAAKEAQVAALTQTISEQSAQIETLKARLAVYEPADEPEDDADPAEATPLPEDFPARDKLVAKGYSTVEAVAKASDDALNKISGIGDATIKEIKEALEKLEQE